MTTELLALADLASRKYPDLTSSETDLLSAVQHGRIASPRNGTEHDKRDNTFRIRAELLRWLCTDKEAVAHVHHRGIRIMSGSIEGELDLGFTTISFPLEFLRCSIPGLIDLESATIARLSLRDTMAGRIWAVQLKVQGDVKLSGSFQSTGGVILDGAHINGSLDCTGGKILSNNTALSIFSGKIGGNVFFARLQAIGEINLRMATVEGTIDCQGAHFFNFEVTEGERNKPRRYALVGSQLHVKGSIFFRFGFEAVGGTQLISATIGRDLDCSGARFLNSEKAIEADRIVVGGDAFFRDKFEANGVVWLLDANIGGSVIFRRAEFMDINAPGGDGPEREKGKEAEGIAQASDLYSGVNLEAATIKRTLVWRDIQKTDNTRLNLIDTAVGRFFDDGNSWPKAGNLFIFGFRYERISGVSDPQRRRQWLQLQAEGATLQPYEQLAGVLRAAGHNVEARKVAIDREDKRYRWQSWKRLPAWLWGRFLKYTIGYGYMSSRALCWAAAFVLLGRLIFSFGYKEALLSPIAEGIYKGDAYRGAQTLPDGYQTFSPLMYSLDTFLPIINLYQEPTWLPNPNRKCIIAGARLPCGKYLRRYLWLHIIVGWSLTTLVVAGFTGIIRKD